MYGKQDAKFFFMSQTPYDLSLSLFSLSLSLSAGILHDVASIAQISVAKMNAVLLSLVMGRSNRFAMITPIPVPEY